MRIKTLLFSAMLFFVTEAAYAAGLDSALRLLKQYRDSEALAAFEEVLEAEPGNLDAAWGRAEVFRRQKKFAAAKQIFNEILVQDPDHASALISLAYLRYKDGEYKPAIESLQKVLRKAGLGKEDRAMAYILIGAVNSKKAMQAGLWSKILYGTRIKGYFLKAVELDPDLAEAHLGLGTFCLMAPSIAGGNIEKAIEELEYAVKLAPAYATAFARLAQAYQKKGDKDKYHFYLKQAQELDPENEALKELIQIPTSNQG